MIEVILVTYSNSNPAFTPLQKRPFQLAKIRDYNVDFLFFWGHIPDPHNGDGRRATAPLLIPLPRGAP